MVEKSCSISNVLIGKSIFLSEKVFAFNNILIACPKITSAKVEKKNLRIEVYERNYFFIIKIVFFSLILYASLFLFDNGIVYKNAFIYKQIDDFNLSTLIVFINNNKSIFFLLSLMCSYYIFIYFFLFITSVTLRDVYIEVSVIELKFSGGESFCFAGSKNSIEDAFKKLKDFLNNSNEEKNLILSFPNINLI